MTRSSDAVLFATPVLAPKPVLDAMTLPHGARVAASNDLPTGWACALLNLWPDVLKDENRSLIATLTKPRPNPHANRSDGELLRNLRRRVQGWLNGAGLPQDAVAPTAEMRARLYAEAATFATGSPDGWPHPVAAHQEPAKKTVKPQQPAKRQPHKPHGPRRDLYWATDHGQGAPRALQGRQRGRQSHVVGHGSRTPGVAPDARRGARRRLPQQPGQEDSPCASRLRC